MLGPESLLTRAVEAGARQAEPKIAPNPCDEQVSALHADIVIPDVESTRHLVHRLRIR